MLNGDVNWHVSQSGDSSYKNKISKFLQSEFVRDLFPEHNSRSTNPNYQFGLVNRNNNYNHNYSQKILPRYTKSTSRQKVFSEDEVSTGRPQLSSRNETRGSNRTEQLKIQNQEMLAKIHALENELKSPINYDSKSGRKQKHKKNKKKKHRKSTDSDSSDSDDSPRHIFSNMRGMPVMPMRPPISPYNIYPPWSHLPSSLPFMPRFEPREKSPSEKKHKKRKTSRKKSPRRSSPSEDSERTLSRVSLPSIQK